MISYIQNIAAENSVILPSTIGFKRTVVGGIFFMEFNNSKSTITLDGEVWYSIPESNNTFLISNFFRIKRKEKAIEFVKRNKPYVSVLKEKIISKVVDNTGYVYFNNWRGLRPRKLYLHRLVAKTFIPNPENKPEVNHINGDRQDYSLQNLEWVTKSENSLHNIHVMGYKQPKKPQSSDSKYSKRVAQYDLFGNLVKLWDCQTDVQRTHGWQQSSISAVCRGVRKEAYGFVWKFAN